MPTPALAQWLGFAVVVLILVVGGLFWWHQNHPSHGCTTSVDVVTCR